MTRLDLTENEPRGDNAIDWLRWVLSGVWAVTVILGGAWLTQIDHRLITMEDSDRASSATRERLSAVEVRQLSTQHELEANMDDIKKALDKLDKKFDQLLYANANMPSPSTGARRFDK